MLIRNMQKLMFRLASSGILAFLFVVFGQVATANAASINITGTVSSPSGTGVQSTLVTATAPNSSIVLYGPSTTASDGSYTLAVDPGTYDFHFTPPSGSEYNPATVINFTVMTDQVLSVQFTPLTHMFSGTLRDGKGNPIPNTYIDFLPSGQAHVDANGHFSIALTPGTYGIQVDRAFGGSNGLGNGTDLSSPTDYIDITNGDQIQDVVIPTVQIAVTLKDANGTPISGVYVQSDPRGNISLMPDSSKPTVLVGQAPSGNVTDANGMVVLTGLNGSTYTQVDGTTSSQGNICAFQANSTPLCLTAPFTVSGDTNVNLTAPITHTFSGTLRDGQGNVISNTYIDFLPSGQAHVDGVGHFSIALNPGTYGIHIDRAFGGSNGIGNGVDLSSPTNYIDVTNSDLTQDVVIPTVHVTVILKDSSGNPLSGVYVQSDPRGNISLLPGGSNQTVVVGEAPSGNITDSSGVVVLTGLNRSTYTQVNGATSSQGNICAFPPNASPVCSTAPQTITGDTTVNLVAVVTHTFSGTLRDGQGNPIPNTYLDFLPSGQAQVDADGHFSVSLAAGTYGVRLDRAFGGNNGLGNGTDLSSPANYFDLSNGSLTEDIIVPTVHLTVTLKDANGNPLSGAYVQSDPRGNISFLTDGSNPTVAVNQAPSGATTDTSGMVSITGLKGSTYTQVNGATSSQDNICAFLPNASPVCLSAQFTVTRDTSVVLQQQSQATVPTLTSATSVTFVARDVSNFTVTTTGNPFASITESGTLPDGLTFRDNGNGTASILGQASLTNAGIYFLTFNATNIAGTTSQSFVLRVNNAQTAPVFVNTGTITENFGTVFNYVISSTGNPLPNIKRSTAGNAFPTGVSIKDNNDGTATLSGNGNVHLLRGTYVYTLQTKNKNGTTLQDFTLVIN